MSRPVAPGDCPAIFQGGVADSKLFEVAANEGVAALLAYQLRINDQLENLASGLRDRLRVIELQSAAIDLRRRLEVSRILALLKAANIDFIVLKGEALAHSLYPEPHLRSRCDIDLLFADKVQAERVWSILRSEGYARTLTLEGQFVGFQFSCSKRLKNGLDITFDIHNQISDYLWFAKRFPYQKLRKNAAFINVDGVDVAVLDLPYALLHACLHRVSNKPHKIQDRLIWLYDIQLICEAQGEEQWNDFLQIAMNTHMAKTCLEAIRQAEKYLELKLPSQAIERLKKHADFESSGLNGLEKRWQLYLSDFLNNKGFLNKAAQLREHLVPSKAYMMCKYPIRKQWQLPYYYVKRIVLGLKKYS